MPTPPASSGPPDGHQSFHAWLRELDGGEGRIRVHAFLPARGGESGQTLPSPFAQLADRLELTPWRHQASALHELAAGRDVVLATPTASGKSLAYQLPVLDAVARDRTALLMFPTKALAHDQLGALRAMADKLGQQNVNEWYTDYDGDTPRPARSQRRATARAIVTNPDMLHLGVLPFHPAWAPFLARLDLIVVDELHAYRGVLGSHVANVLWRLLRLAATYGSAPTIVAASATIANPAALFHALTGRHARIVNEDSAPHGAREVVFWEPPAAPGGEGRRRSPLGEAASLAATFVQHDIRSLFFCNSRRSAELVARQARSRLSESQALRVDAYRAGYDADERRRIEQGFAAGEITVLAATSALELGVDVGGVDAVAMVGYPGSSMSFWQRAGRAGRAGGRALTLMVPAEDPLDEHYLNHPDQILEGAVEAAVADGHNEVIHAAHLTCAAAEHALDADESWLAPGVELSAIPGLELRDGRWHARGWYPHRRVGLRGTTAGRVRLVEATGGKSFGTVDVGRALRELYVGAVHLHRGEAHLVVELDLDARKALLLPHIEDWYTQVRSETRIELPQDGGADARLALELGLPAGLSVGRVRVIHEVGSYVRKRYRTGAILNEFPLDLPAESFITQAAWISLAPEAAAGTVEPAVLPAGMHALEHALIGLLPAFVLCERADVGGVSYPRHPQLEEPTVFVYDGVAGGVGYAAAGAHVAREWLAAAHQRLRDCACTSGCPRCILSPKCGNGNQYLDKVSARRIAEALLRRFAHGSSQTADA